MGSRVVQIKVGTRIRWGDSGFDHQLTKLFKAALDYRRAAIGSKVVKMNLTKFIRKNNIKSKDGEVFDHSPEFFKMKEFENTCHVIYSVPFLEPEIYKVQEFDVMLTGFIQEKRDKNEKNKTAVFH